ncbi:dynamin family protein [Roseospira visakhapatnamensis]|uniref:Dynamin N-terminal domain-containing protein n=1 Tax=Roseospira visakhapatnamensis TaxID=390880 RepID=A0A7W6RCL6_9PROT|nr:dynamin family protein [Roseospira visakhapatnamensis]MBB4265958.1 hypothetical protein [Roseospira visakhapatnamensis]
MSTPKSLRKRLRTLEKHLKTEYPGLVTLLPTFRRVDALLYRMGLLDRGESLATRIPWWPLVSVLGTFSAGKSTFINSTLGVPLQATGNQAVDDKFTVICYGEGQEARVLPGTALNADPRFPFFRISDEIEKVAPGEGKRIDAYLQLKTVNSPLSKGLILIDSPGFDSDDQRRSTLRITDHIIDLSDLVLIFFDARHPEPGAMHDTLQHLVSKTVRRADTTKFLYILNQIDTTAMEDNATEVVGAWQRTIAQAGLISGRFYAIYNSDCAVPIDNPALEARYEAKRDHDMGEITARIQEIGVGRSYRIIAMLETVINELESEVLPYLSKQLRRFRGQVMILDIVWAVVLAAGLGGVVALSGGDLVTDVGTWVSGTAAPAVAEGGATVAPKAAEVAGTGAGAGAGASGAAQESASGLDWRALAEQARDVAAQGISQGTAALSQAGTWLGDALSGIGQGAGAVATRVLALLVGLWLLFQVGHQAARAVVAARLAPQVSDSLGHMGLDPRAAFRRNTGFGRRVYRSRPVGWTAGAERKLDAIRDIAMTQVQKLNDLFADPSGRRGVGPRRGVSAPPSSPAPATAPAGATASGAAASAFAPPPPDPLAVPDPDTTPGDAGDARPRA